MVVESVFVGLVEVVGKGWLSGSKNSSVVIARASGQEAFIFLGALSILDRTTLNFLKITSMHAYILVDCSASLKVGSVGAVSR